MSLSGLGALSQCEERFNYPATCEKMASQVTVIGPSARRHVTKVMPGTYLVDVLHEACTKFRLDSSQYGLK